MKWLLTIYINDDIFQLRVKRRLRMEEIARVYKCNEEEIIRVDEEYIEN